MQEIINVKRSGGTHSAVAIGHVIDSLDEFIPQGRRVIVITDENLYGIYRDVIDRYESIVIGLGEENKTLATLAHIYRELLKKGADRQTFIVGFGGGIVTDITGFAASTYMRGLDFGFVASTLLAQVDASVGGKNGVNFEGFKNMVGTFNQPEFVLCDQSLLESLPDREMRSGMAEIIKSGLILDAGLFQLFEVHTFSDFRNDKALLQEAVTRAVKVKKTIVDRDEKETGDRKKLNLGHTFAHAIEKCSRRFSHGEAVAIGTVMIADLSVRLGTLSAADAERIRRVMENTGLPTESGIDLSVLFEAMKSDKKKAADSIDLILNDGIGACRIRKFSFQELNDLLLSENR